MGNTFAGGVSFPECLAPLRDLVNTVEATGGLVEWPDGSYTPECDHEWDDLGRAALDAYNVLRAAGHPVELRIRKETDDDE